MVLKYFNWIRKNDDDDDNGNEEEKERPNLLAFP